jgi:hypothetical protein
MKPPALDSWQSGQKTAQKACEILVAMNNGFVVPTSRQKANLLVAFARKGKVVYGRAFDIVKTPRGMNLDDLSDVEKNLSDLVVFEVKSTKKRLKSDFSSFFFGLSGAEVLVAQSLKDQFRFAFVNTATGDHMELTLAEMFSKAKGIYSTWSIRF